MEVGLTERRVKPGALARRLSDRKIGIVVGMKEPVWAMDGHILENYWFMLFIDNTLIQTSSFTSQFSLVQ